MATMKPPVADDDSKTDELEMKVLELTELVQKQALMIQELGTRVGTPPQGWPLPNPSVPLDADDQVNARLALNSKIKEDAEKAAATGPKAWDVLLAVGPPDNRQRVESTRRRIGAASKGEAVEKYKELVGIIDVGAPTTIVADAA